MSSSLGDAEGISAHGLGAAFFVKHVKLSDSEPRSPKRFDKTRPSESGLVRVDANQRRSRLQYAMRFTESFSHLSLVEAPSSTPEVVEYSNDAVARLAYSYWEARGYQGGSPEEDWLRAEQELRATITSK